MTTKHTPGPWVFDDEGSIRGADDSPVVFPVVDLDNSIVPADADALLIAAAPDLLHVAEMVLRGAADGALYGFAEAAVRKAKGEP